MKKKVILSLIFFCIAFSIVNAQPGGATIKYVGSAVTTFYNVGCETFSNSFSDADCMILKIKPHTHDIKIIDSCMKFFKVDKSITTMDVRIKITCRCRGKDIAICMDYAGNFYRSDLKRYMVNKPLSDFVFKKIGFNGW